jgi:hypothetical protein
MTGSAVITGGDYLLELSTGYDSSAFYLDDSLLDGPDVLDGDGIDFIDITPVVQTIRLTRSTQTVRCVWAWHNGCVNQCASTQPCLRPV